VSCCIIAYLDISKKNIINTYQKNEITAKEAQLKQYENMIKEVKAHNSRLQVIANDTGKLKEQISNIKIEGKCIKDESYYKTATDIVDRFNNSLR
jgi:hypothetical protein